MTKLDSQDECDEGDKNKKTPEKKNTKELTNL